MGNRKARVLTMTALALGGLIAGTATATAATPTAHPTVRASDQSERTPCEPQAKACVSLSAQRAWLQKDGNATYGSVPITSGRKGEETPVGIFHVQWKDRDHKSSEFNNAPMPFSVFFTTTGVAFHEGSLQKESAGCVHLSHSAAERFFDTLNPGDEVQVLP